MISLRTMAAHLARWPGARACDRRHTASAARFAHGLVMRSGAAAMSQAADTPGAEGIAVTRKKDSVTAGAFYASPGPPPHARGELVAA